MLEPSFCYADSKIARIVKFLELLLDAYMVRSFALLYSCSEPLQYFVVGPMWY